MWWFYPFNSDKLDYLGKEWDVAKLWRVFHDSVVQVFKKYQSLALEGRTIWHGITQKMAYSRLVRLSLVHGFEEDESGQPRKLVGC